MMVELTGSKFINIQGKELFIKRVYRFESCTPKRNLIKTKRPWE